MGGRGGTPLVIFLFEENSFPKNMADDATELSSPVSIAVDGPLSEIVEVPSSLRVYIVNRKGVWIKLDHLYKNTCGRPLSLSRKPDVSYPSNTKYPLQRPRSSPHTSHIFRCIENLSACYPVIKLKGCPLIFPVLKKLRLNQRLSF